MRHGRPERFESGYCNVFGTWRWFRPERGWRREHAARVFQAIQAVMACHAFGVIHSDRACKLYPFNADVMAIEAGWSP